MDLDLPDELVLLRRTVRDFVEERLRPIEQQVEEEGRIPAALITEMGRLGYFGLPFPEEYGGAGAGDLGYCVALEQFGRASAAFSRTASSPRRTSLVGPSDPGSRPRSAPWTSGGSLSPPAPSARASISSSSP